jgi:hypothetical protein
MGFSSYKIKGFSHTISFALTIAAKIGPCHSFARIAGHLDSRIFGRGDKPENIQ